MHFIYFFLQVARHTRLKGHFKVGATIYFVPGAVATQPTGWNRVTPFTDHTDVGLGIIHQKPGWQRGKHYLPNMVRNQTYLIVFLFRINAATCLNLFIVFVKSEDSAIVLMKLTCAKPIQFSFIQFIHYISIHGVSVKIINPLKGLGTSCRTQNTISTYLH